MNAKFSSLPTYKPAMKPSLQSVSRPIGQLDRRQKWFLVVLGVAVVVHLIISLA